MVARSTHEDITSNPYELSRSLVGIARRRSSSTRAELVAASTGGKSIVVQRIAELVELGVLIEGLPKPSTGGRAPRAIRFNGHGALLVGAEITATQIHVTITDFFGTMIELTSEDNDVRGGPNDSLGRLGAAVRRAISRLPASHPPILGIGVGMPGPVDFAAGAMVAPPNLESWDSYPVRERLEADLGYPVWVDNDVNAMAIGEHAFDEPGSNDLIVINVASGIGAGLIIGGRIFRGVEGGAGDIGHVAYGGSSVPCVCGKVGCLSTIASEVAIGRQANAAADRGTSAFLTDLRAEKGILSAHDVVRGAAMGDPVSTKLITDAGTHVGKAVAMMVGVTNPSLVIVAGELSVESDLFLETVRRTVLVSAPTLATRNLTIRASELGARAGAIGAALLCVDAILTSDRIREWVESATKVFLVQ